MTRKKVELKYIANDARRKATLKKRKCGLIKKVYELSTLCGIEACAIIYTPNDPQPEIWPSPLGVQNVLARFRNMSELEQSKKMVNQESFLKHRLLKAQEQLKKQRNENRKKEMTLQMFQYLGASPSVGNSFFSDMNMFDLKDLSWLIEQNLKDISLRKNRGEVAQVKAAQVEAPISLADGGAAMNGEMVAYMDHVHGHQGLKKVEDVQNHNWSLGLINGYGGGNVDEMLPFGDDLQNGFCPKPVSP